MSIQYQHLALLRFKLNLSMKLKIKLFLDYLVSQVTMIHPLRKNLDLLHAHSNRPIKKIVSWVKNLEVFALMLLWCDGRLLRGENLSWPEQQPQRQLWKQKVFLLMYLLKKNCKIFKELNTKLFCRRIPGLYSRDLMTPNLSWSNLLRILKEN
jgi:hypothetical protein